MKNKLMGLMFGIFMVLGACSLISAETLYLDETNISADMYLDKSNIPYDFYTFITWDLQTFLNDPTIDINSLEAELSLAVVGGTYQSHSDIYLIPDQTLDLNSATTSQIYTSQKTNSVDYYFSNTGTGLRHNINISELIRDSLRDNRNNRYLTLRIEDSTMNTVIPYSKSDSGTLYVGSNSNSLVFGSSTQNSVDDYKPKLTITYGNEDTSNITVFPYEFRWLPQINSSKPLDNKGLERTLLYCTWRIDGKGEEAIPMSSNLCPEQRQNQTFTEDETYVVRIDYADIFWNITSSEWQLSETGKVEDIEYKYNMNLPEPSSNFLTSIWETIYNTIKSWVCGIFPGLGFCS